jgi:hypothetical protein
LRACVREGVRVCASKKQRAVSYVAN